MCGIAAISQTFNHFSHHLFNNEIVNGNCSAVIEDVLDIIDVPQVQVYIRGSSSSPLLVIFIKQQQESTLLETKVIPRLPQTIHK